MEPSPQGEHSRPAQGWKAQMLWAVAQPCRDGAEMRCRVPCPCHRTLSVTFLSDLSPPQSSKNQILPEHFLPALPALLSSLSIQLRLVRPHQGVQVPSPASHHHHPCCGPALLTSLPCLPWWEMPKTCCCSSHAVLLVPLWEPLLLLLKSDFI